MASMRQKKIDLCMKIRDAAGIYSRELAGKTFLYVYGNEWFEVLFETKCFLHLTGVATGLSSESFYSNAKNRTLQHTQFYFDPPHYSYGNAKKKVPCLLRLPELTNTCVCILRDTETVTFTYKMSVTNLEFTLGLTENLDSNNIKINDYYLPKTLRVRDSAVERSASGEVVDFIFCKDASLTKYDTLMFSDNRKEYPDEILPMLNEKFR